MLYNINISQKAIIDLGVDNLDYTDLSIFNAIEFACANSETIKLTEGGNQYTMVAPSFIKEQLPLLQHNSTETIKRRIKKLIDVGLVESFDKNQSIQRSYYKMGKLYSKYKSYSKNESSLSKMKDKTVKNERLPMSKMKDYNNITNNNITNNNNGYRISFKDFLNKYPSNLDEQKAYNYFYSYLTDDEKQKAIDKIDLYLRYLEVANKQAYLKAPTNYLKDKTFNTDFEAEIKRIEKYSKKPEPEPKSRFKEIL